MSFVSYAQNFEDVLLHRVFGGQETGFYIDVGAYHPVIGSTTKAFYDRGWSGINVEPGSVFAELAAARPRDVNLQMAVMDRTGEIAFIEDEADRGMSHVAMNEVGGGTGRMISCDTLEGIVRAHSRGRPVDFVKIDAEGAEAVIVLSTDWRVLRPRVLLLEATLPWSSKLSNQEWEPKLLEEGYVRSYFDGINCFYVPEEEVPALLGHFRAPVNAMDRVVQYDCDVLRIALGNQQQETARLAAEWDAARAAMEREAAQFAAERDAIQAAMERETARLAAERDAARATMEREAAQFAAERDAARATVVREAAQFAAERDAARATVVREAAQFAAERDAARATVVREAAQFAAERDAIQAAMERETARLAAERDTAQAAMENQRRETVRLATERDAMRSQADHFAHLARELEARLAAPAPVIAPKPPIRRTMARRVALAVYWLVRPVARPLLWRLRGFLVAGFADHLQHLNAHVAAIPDQFMQLHAQIAALQGTPSAVYVANDGAADEMRRLALEMERTLLTLAIERSPDTQRDIQPATAPVEPPAAPTYEPVGLLLPHGRTVEVECMPGDLSVGASLRASSGDWEPHVRHFLETVVRPDWVCLDIGANIGAHTLSMAVLAYQGRVVAFEADPANFQLLSRNAGALLAKRADIESVRVALWDSHCTLICGGADELAGCSFVADDVSDRTSVERRLRRVVALDALSGRELHMRLSEVLALPLDMWVKDNPLQRLDLIKLDVEGAEARVIRGAEATLRRYRPILVVEYNPACAEAYFGQAPDDLFHELKARFTTICALEPDGSLTPTPDWMALQTRLSAGKGWEDLVCKSE